MLFNTFASSRLPHRHRKSTKWLDEIQLAFLRQVIRLNRVLNRLQVLPLLWDHRGLLAIAFLFGMLLGSLVVTLG
jgi:hypothetical protein